MIDGRKISFLQKTFCLLFFTILFTCCSVEKTAVSCPGGGPSKYKTTKETILHPHLLKKRKNAKAEDGFKHEDKKTKRASRKAEKGKKKEKKETKAERKWSVFKKHIAAENDKSSIEKGNSRKNERKQKKIQKKRMRHPQNGTAPKGQV